jgi:hypothetical protein
MCRLIQFPHLPHSKVCRLESPGASTRVEERKATCSCLPSPVAAGKVSSSIQTLASRLWLLGKPQACSHVQSDFQVPLWRNRGEKKLECVQGSSGWSSAESWAPVELDLCLCALGASWRLLCYQQSAKHQAVEQWVVLARDLLDISATLTAEAT